MLVAPGTFDKRVRCEKCDRKFTINTFNPDSKVCPRCGSHKYRSLTFFEDIFDIFG